MTHFYNSHYGYYISTNFKVMYSTLLAQSELRLLNNRLRRFSDMMGLRKHYLIVRSPFLRIESLFKDKLRMLPRKILNSKSQIEFEEIQLKILKFMGINMAQADEALAQIMLGIEWNQFLNVLPHIIDNDPHAYPQNQILHERFMGIDFTWQPEEILKIENQGDLSFIQHKLGINLKIKKNTSDSVDEIINWTEANRKQIVTLYEQDFLLFNYDTLLP